MLSTLLLLSILTWSPGSSCISYAEDLPSLKTVQKVDLSRYLGEWYEIARFPNSFQKGCDRAKAKYTLVDDDKIQVVNTCVRVEDGKTSEAEGVAYVEDKSTNAKLKVNFVPGFLRWTGIGNGDYWIIGLDSNYSYAVVSEPKRKYLWILSRTPELPQKTLNEILMNLRDQGFDISQLIYSKK